MTNWLHAHEREAKATRKINSSHTEKIHEYKRESNKKERDKEERGDI